MDHRDRVAKFGRGVFPEGYEFDEQKMLVTFAIEDEDENEVEYTIPVCFEVCPTCEGKGSHVNPSIDSHGLSREDFDEDPDFREEYFSGAYDVTCYACSGKRVVIEPKSDFKSPAALALAAWQDAEARDVRERIAEERWGY